MKNNLLLTTDSYKQTHYLQYPKNTTYLHSYIESRGGLYGYTKFFGLQYILKEYLSKPFTKEDIKEAKKICNLHGIPFNEEGFEYILEKYNGFFPVRIRAVPEGMIVKNHNVLVTIESTDEKVPWIVGFIETMLLKVWYPITVATYSYKIKKIIEHFMNITSDNLENIEFMLHDFGYRGVSSEESAGIGGMAHLTNFKGTDTMKSLLFVKEYYSNKDEEFEMPGFSVPASEHSTTTSWLKENERKAFENMLDSFPNNIFSIVADSYNYFNAVDNIIGIELREKIKNRPNNTTIRPDSGDAITNVLFTLESADKNFGSVINSKGYKVLNKIRILQGDGITENTIWDLLKATKELGYSAENLIFGCGGALLQGNANSSINRDTHKFALKCSAIMVDDKIRDVYKNPITDRGKISKKGRLDLIIENNEFKTINISDYPLNKYHENSILETVFENGKLLKEYSFSEVRENENLNLWSEFGKNIVIKIKKHNIHKYEIKFVKFNEEKISRGNFNDREIGIISEDYPEYYVKNNVALLYIPGKYITLDEQSLFVNELEMQDIIEKIKLIDKKYQ